MRSSAAQPALNPSCASALRRLVASAALPLRGIPVGALLELASTIDPADSVTLDLESARRIGVPIVVIRSLRCGGAPFVLGRLTRREQEVARRVARGWPNKRVAADLGISLATVKDHVHHVLAKTGLASRGELTAAFPREDL